MPPHQIYAKLLDGDRYLCSIRTMYRILAAEHGQLTVHADRGPSMKSKVVAHLLSDLGVTKTHSWPHVSNDSPYSEAQFKTLK